MSDPAAVPPVPADAEAFDAWARDELDRWRLPRVRQVAAAIWEDPASHPSWRAVAGIWLGGEDGPATPEELLAAAEVPGLPPFFSARLRAVAAGEVRATDPERARTLVDGAVAEVRDPAVDQRSRLAVLRTAAEIALRSGRLVDAVAVLDEARQVLGDEAAAPNREAIVVAAVQLDVIGAALAHERRQPAGERQPERITALAQACLHQARATAALAAAAPDVPAVISIRIGVARVLGDLGVIAEAEPLLASVDVATEGIDEALALRFQALLALADCRLDGAGPEAALEVQQRAIEAVRPLGATPMLAWAQRGLALQLRAAGRHEEAGPAFEAAVALMEQVGQPVDALQLRMEQARGLAEAGEDATEGRTAEAAALVDRVLVGLDDLDPEARAQLEPGARDLAGRLASARLDHDAAIEHWLRLVDLAPTVGISVADPRSAAALEMARSGEVEEAELLFGQAEVDAADGPEPEYHLALVMGRRARVQHRAGEHEDAAELLRIAVNHARVAEDPVLVGRLSLQLAEAHEAHGQRQAAVDVLLDARAEGQAAGQDDLVAAADARLAALGHG